MRKEYELTAVQKAVLLAAMQPVPYLIAGGMPPRSQQENANTAWKALGAEMGFDGMTVERSSKGDQFFTAETTA